jgi:hypothetical protein
VRLTDELLAEVRSYNLSVLDHVNADETDLQLFRQLAGSIVFSKHEQYLHSPLKHSTILLRVNNPAQVEVVEKIVQMHAYWRLKGLTVTLTIWNECAGNQKNFLQRLIMELITNGVGAESLNRPDGIFLKSIDKLAEEDRKLLREAAYVIKAESWEELSLTSAEPALDAGKHIPANNILLPEQAQ